MVEINGLCPPLTAPRLFANEQPRGNGKICRRPLSKNIGGRKKIGNYIKIETPLPPFIPYPQFLLGEKLPHTACLLYALLLDRTTLSQKNNWTSENGNVYVIYPVESMAEHLHCGISTIVRALKKLEQHNLIERRREGFSTPNRVFVKMPGTVQKCAVIIRENEQSECAKVSRMTAQKCTPNQLNNNQSIINQSIKTNYYGQYQNVVLSELDYEILRHKIYDFDELLDQLSAYMKSTGKRYADHAATLRLWAKRQKLQSTMKQKSIPVYSHKEGESL